MGRAEANSFSPFHKCFTKTKVSKVRCKIEPSNAWEKNIVDPDICKEYPKPP